MAVGGTRRDALGANAFWLEFGQDKVASFQEVSGIENETEVRELQQVGRDGKVVVIKTQGAAALKSGKITAKYAAFKGDPCWIWRQQVVVGSVEAARKNISIVLYDTEDREQARYSFLNCWPSKYAFSNLTSKGNDTLTVTLTIEHEGQQIIGYNS